MSSPFLFLGDPLATVATLRALADDLENLTVFLPRKKLLEAPVLSDWSFAKRTSNCLSGRVEAHPVLGACSAITSELFAMDPDAGWARTYSRYYRLGPALGQGGWQ